MPQLGPPELIIILVIILVVFGAGKLPEIGGALGKGVREFKNATKEIEGAKDDVKAASDDIKQVSNDIKQAVESEPTKEKDTTSEA